MWINNFFRKTRETLKATKEPIPNQKRCEEFAADAYAYCIKLFGPPVNPKRPYALIRGVGEASSCSYAWGWYIITLSPELGMIEDQCLTIGHEMYHRFTMHRTGLRRQVWLDETLAVFTSLGFLQQSEFSNIADDIISNSANYPVNIDLRKLQDFHKFPWYAGLMSLGQKYPEDFYQNIVRLAVALKAILSSREFSQVLNAASLKQWIASLPEEKQYAVCRILEVSSEGKKSPDNDTSLNLFLRALKAKGNKEVVVAEMQLVTKLQPANGAVFAYLAIAYICADDTVEALSAYLKAYTLGFAEPWIFSRIGGIYYLNKDYTRAVEWLQKAAEFEPDLPKVLYRLGRSLNSLGCLREAHEAWERILTLEDNKFKDLTRKTIAENPLPNGIDEE